MELDDVVDALAKFLRVGSVSIIVVTLRDGALVAAVTISAVCLAVFAPIWILPVGIGVAALVIFGVRRPNILAPLLLLAAIPFTRPNIFGDIGAPVGFGLSAAGLLVALLADRGVVKAANQVSRPARLVLLWTAAGQAWLLLRALIIGEGELSIEIGSLVLTVGALAAAIVVVSDQRRARIVAAGFVGLTVLIAASFILTLVYWQVAGMRAGLVSIAGVGQGGTGYQIYYPLTITLGTQSIAGAELPRLTGFAREPGLMAMWCTYALFLLPHVTKSWVWLWRSFLLAGMIGTFSAAGFAVLLGVLAVRWFFLPAKPVHNPFLGYLRLLSGGAAIAIAVWLSLYAPIAGFEAKAERDPNSVSERMDATMAGIRALVESPLFGGDEATKWGGVNLIAAIASAGLPYVLMVTAAFLVPIRAHPRWREVGAPVLALLLTLAVAQPPRDSVWVLVAAVIALAAVTSAPLAAPTPLCRLHGHQLVGRSWSIRGVRDQRRSTHANRSLTLSAAKSDP